MLFDAAAEKVTIEPAAVGSVPDFLSERDTVLVARSWPKFFARAIEELLENKPGRRARLVNAQTRVETQFALAPWLDRYEEIYSDLL